MSLDDYTVLGYELLARGPLQSELHRPDALFEVARGQGRDAELDRLCRLDGRAHQRHPAGGVPALHQHRAGQPVLANTRSDLIVRELVEATPPELRRQTIVELTENSVIEDFSHMREVVRQLRDYGLPHRHRRRRRRLFRPADHGRDRARLHQARHEPDARPRDVVREAEADRHAARLLPRRPASSWSPRASRPRPSSMPSSTSASPTGRASCSPTRARRTRCSVTIPPPGGATCGDRPGRRLDPRERKRKPAAALLAPRRAGVVESRPRMTTQRRHQQQHLRRATGVAGLWRA